MQIEEKNEWRSKSLSGYVYTRQESDDFRQWLDNLPKSAPVGDGHLAATCQVHLCMLDWSRLLSLRQKKVIDGGEPVDIDEIVSDLVTMALDEAFDCFTP